MKPGHTYVHTILANWLLSFLKSPLPTPLIVIEPGRLQLCLPLAGLASGQLSYCVDYTYVVATIECYVSENSYINNL